MQPLADRILDSAVSDSLILPTSTPLKPILRSQCPRDVVENVDLIGELGVFVPGKRVAVLLLSTR